MKQKKETSFDWFDWIITIFLGAVAIFSIRSLFQSDSNRIISNDGNEYIQDEKNISKLNSIFIKNEISDNQHSEIVI